MRLIIAVLQSARGEAVATVGRRAQSAHHVLMMKILFLPRRTHADRRRHPHAALCPCCGWLGLPLCANIHRRVAVGSRHSGWCVGDVTVVGRVVGRVVSLHLHRRSRTSASDALWFYRRLSSCTTLSRQKGTFIKMALATMLLAGSLTTVTC